MTVVTVVVVVTLVTVLTVVTVVTVLTLLKKNRRKKKFIFTFDISKTQIWAKIKFGHNPKTPIVTKLKNSDCDKTQKL